MNLRFLFSLYLLLSPFVSEAIFASPDICVLYNSNLPRGKIFAQAYATHYELDDSSLLGIAMPLEENISHAIYQSSIAGPLKLWMREKNYPTGQPDVILTVFGVPLFVDDGKRLRSVDRLISILNRKGPPLGEALAVNPFWRGKVQNKENYPVPVSRLDAPTSGDVVMMLNSWKNHSIVGAFKRYLPDKIPSERFHLLKNFGLVVQENKEPLPPAAEIQYIEATGEALQQMARRHLALAPGAVVVKDSPVISPMRDGPFRSKGKSASSAACLIRAGFYIGRSGETLKEYEDFFDRDAFLAAYLEGASFANAAQAGMAHVGGSILVIGDPLARPFHPMALEHFEKFFETPRPADDSPAVKAMVSDAAVWWFAREALLDWYNGKAHLSIGKLRGSARLRPTTGIYFELAGKLMIESGMDDRLPMLLDAWKHGKLEPYYQNVKQELLRHIPE